MFAADAAAAGLGDQCIEAWSRELLAIGARGRCSSCHLGGLTPGGSVEDFCCRGWPVGGLKLA